MGLLPPLTVADLKVLIALVRADNARLAADIAAVQP